MNTALFSTIPLLMCMVAIAALAFMLRKRALPYMDGLRLRIEDADATAIADFRRLHVTGMAVNLVQLAFLVWGLFHFFRQAG